MPAGALTETIWNSRDAKKEAEGHSACEEEAAPVDALPPSGPSPSGEPNGNPLAPPVVVGDATAGDITLGDAKPLPLAAALPAAEDCCCWWRAARCQCFSIWLTLKKPVTALLCRYRSYLRTGVGGGRWPAV